MLQPLGRSVGPAFDLWIRKARIAKSGNKDNPLAMSDADAMAARPVLNRIFCEPAARPEARHAVVCAGFSAEHIKLVGVGGFGFCVAACCHCLLVHGIVLWAAEIAVVDLPVDRTRDLWKLIRASTGSSRSAVFCRSPCPPTTPMSRSAPSPPGARPGRSGTGYCGRRCGAFMPRTSASMAGGRSGAGSAAKGRRSRAARWHG